MISRIVGERASGLQSPLEDSRTDIRRGAEIPDNGFSLSTVELHKHPNSLVPVRAEAGQIFPSAGNQDEEVRRPLASIGDVEATIKIFQLCETIVHLSNISIHEHLMSKVQVNLPTRESETLLEELNILEHVVLRYRESILAKLGEVIECDVHTSLLRLTIILQRNKKVKNENEETKQQ